LGVVGLIAVMALAGYGFATWTASGTVSGSATAGYFELSWGTPSATTDPISGSQVSGTCSAGTVSGNSWSGLSGSAFAPGDGCAWSDTLVNGGNVPANLNWGTPTFYSTDPTSCPSADISGSVSPMPSSIGAGASTPTIVVVMQLSASAPPGCQATLFEFSTLTVTGTVA
jgi:hypothetical protein